MSMLLPVVHCPKLIRDVSDEFKDLWKTRGQYQVFTAVLCAAIFGIAGHSDVYRYIMFSPSVSSISELFAVANLAARLSRRHRRRLLRLLPQLQNNPSRYIWAIDDTIVPHYGPKIWGCYTWWDHVNDCYVNGHRILVVGIVDRKRRLLIPVLWEVLHRDLSELLEGAKPNANHEKHWQVALRLLLTAHQCGFPNVTVVADSGFACEELFDELTKRNIQFVMEIKCNRKVARHGRRTLDESVTDFFAAHDRHIVRHHGKVKFAAEAVVQLKDADVPIKVVAVANERDLDDKPFAYYVSNESAWNASRVWGLARDRWSIEVQFRELKQLFTLGEAAVRSQQAVETTISVAAIALTVIRLEQLAEAERNDNQYRWPRPAGSIVRDLQLNSLRDGVSKLASPHATDVRERFNSRLNYRNLNGKPLGARRVAPGQSRQAMTSRVTAAQCVPSVPTQQGRVIGAAEARRGDKTTAQQRRRGKQAA